MDDDNQNNDAVFMLLIVLLVVVDDGWISTGLLSVQSYKFDRQRNHVHIPSHWNRLPSFRFFNRVHHSVWTFEWNALETVIA